VQALSATDESTAATSHTVPPTLITPSATGDSTGATMATAPTAAATEAATTLDVRVGYRNKQYDGYRVVNLKDISRIEWRKQLINIIEKYGGWPLLENNLTCKAPLRIEEGPIKLDNKSVGGIKCYYEGTINGLYEPGSFDNHGVKYTIKDLNAIQKWEVRVIATNADKDYPCLFVKVDSLPLEE
jgi:hypothetical protein